MNIGFAVQKEDGTIEVHLRTALSPEFIRRVKAGDIKLKLAGKNFLEQTGAIRKESEG